MTSDWTRSPIEYESKWCPTGIRKATKVSLTWIRSELEANLAWRWNALEIMRVALIGKWTSNEVRQVARCGANVCLPCCVMFALWHTHARKHIQLWFESLLFICRQWSEAWDLRWDQPVVPFCFIAGSAGRARLVRCLEMSLRNPLNSCVCWGLVVLSSGSWIETEDLRWALRRLLVLCSCCLCGACVPCSIN